MRKIKRKSILFYIISASYIKLQKACFAFINGAEVKYSLETRVFLLCGLVQIMCIELSISRIHNGCCCCLPTVSVPKSFAFIITGMCFCKWNFESPKKKQNITTVFAEHDHWHTLLAYHNA